MDRCLRNEFAYWFGENGKFSHKKHVLMSMRVKISTSLYEFSAPICHNCKRYPSLQTGPLNQTRLEGTSESTKVSFSVQCSKYVILRT